MPSPWCSINIYKINELYWIQGSWLGLLPDLEAGTLQQCKCLILLDLKDFCSCLHLSSDCKVHDNDSSEPSCGLYLNGSCCLQPRSRAEEWLCAHCVPTSQPDAGREESQGAGSEELLRPPTFYAGQTGTSLARTLRSPYTSQYSVQFSRSVVSDSLRPHEWQHARPPCPSPTPGVHSDSRPSSP